MPLKRTLDSPATQTPRRGHKRRHMHRYRYLRWPPRVDPPTNPFGRIRRLRHNTTLPPPTSFAKHLPLRFQLMHFHADGRDSKRDGVYRVVQVPLNYTLAHLRKLIAYDFDPARQPFRTIYVVH